MKKFFLLVLLCTLTFVLSSCSNIDFSQSDYKIVIKNGYILEGEEDIESFYLKSSLGVPCSIVIDKTYTLEKGNYSEEYYNQNIKEYPKQYITKIVFDGDDYQVLGKNDLGFDTSVTYKIFKHERLEGNEYASYNYVDHYYLVNDASVTYTQYLHSLVSSVLVNIVDLYSLASIYEYKSLHFTETKVYDTSLYLSHNIKEIEIDEFEKTKLFHFIDQLDWQKESMLGPNKLVGDYCIRVSADRVIYNNNELIKFYQKGDNAKLIYILDFYQGVAIMDYISISSSINALYANIECFEFIDLLKTLNIDIDFSTFIESGYYTCGDKYINIYEDGTFILGYTYSSHMLKGEYYVIGDSLFLIDENQGYKMHYVCDDESIVDDDNIFILIK